MAIFYVKKCSKLLLKIMALQPNVGRSINRHVDAAQKTFRTGHKPPSPLQDTDCTGLSGLWFQWRSSNQSLEYVVQFQVIQINRDCFIFPIGNYLFEVKTVSNKDDQSIFQSRLPLFSAILIDAFKL